MWNSIFNKLVTQTWKRKCNFQKSLCSASNLGEKLFLAAFSGGSPVVTALILCRSILGGISEGARRMEFG
jgi:hypothetical protein